MTPEQCRQRAAQCRELADKTNSPKFKKVFSDEAQAWLKLAEEQERVLGSDPWEYGLTGKNRKNLEALVGYSHEQGLIKKRPTLEHLFLGVDQGRKRGGEFRI